MAEKLNSESRQPGFSKHRCGFWSIRIRKMPSFPAIGVGHPCGSSTSLTDFYFLPITKLRSLDSDYRLSIDNRNSRITNALQPFKIKELGELSGSSYLSLSDKQQKNFYQDLISFRSNRFKYGKASSSHSHTTTTCIMVSESG